jgi:LmbE family N-acetylglucosaminyl deacetylase
MKFVKTGAELFIPDGKPIEEAIKRTTHMAISAHQDDIEIMAYHGILHCFGTSDKWFSGVVVTNGSGSPRDDIYAKYTDDEMQKIRKHEQKKAAYVGEYGAMALLNYTSAEVKDSKNNAVVNELKELIDAARPEVIYTHNPTDKHDTHVAVTIRVINAIRMLPTDRRPQRVYGCEVWRALDWLNNEDKVLFDVSAHPNIAAAVLGVHDSQICGGKRYDLATEGRRRANATYAESHGTDNAQALNYAMDLTPLIINDIMDIGQYIKGYVDRFYSDIKNRIEKYL